MTQCMSKIIFLSYQEILEIHEVQLEVFGGLYGVRDKGLLESAIMMPMSGIGKNYFHDDLYKMAAAYLYHIIKNHAFVDGNKRTAVVASITFLKSNGVEIFISQEDLFNLAIGVATSIIKKEEIAEFFRKNSTKKSKK